MEWIKDFFYQLLVYSGLIHRFMPLVKRYVIKYHWLCPDNKNYINTDDSGCTMQMTKFNGKLYPGFGAHNFSKIKNVRIRDDDVIVCGYPKTGCHWTFEIISMIRNKTTSVSKYGKEFGGFIEALPEFVLDSLPSPRVLNTHVPYDDLPLEIKEKHTKIVLTTRCPKDTVVSDYNHHKSLKALFQYNGKFDDYFKLFMKGEVDYGCYFKYASNWTRVMTSPTTPNPIFLMNYEELKSNPLEMIKKLGRFLGVDLTDEFAEGICKSTDFKNVKKVAERDHSAPVLYRKGIVGDWRNWLTEAQSSEMDAKMEETLRPLN